MSTKKATITERVIGCGFFIAAVYCLIRSCILSFSIDIWYDELFSMEFSARPVSELVSLTARDVHPPLYYIILRLLTLLMKQLGVIGTQNGQLTVETAAKLISILPFVILLGYAMTTARKRFGIVAAGLFSFAIITMPQLPEYTTEIRMYSWAILFVTAALLHAFALVQDVWDSREKDGSEKADLKCDDESKAVTRKGRGFDIPNGLALWLYSTAAAYTHYYAAFAVGIIIGLLVILMIAYYVIAMKKKDERGPINFKPVATSIIVMNLVIISYIPWASVVLSQVGAVKESYWIQPVGLRSLGSCAKYLFKGYFAQSELATVLAVILFLVICVLLIKTAIRVVRDREKNAALSLYAFLVLPLLVAAGLLASILIRPVFVNRYMLPSYGCFWLAVSAMAGRELKDFLEKREHGRATALVASALLMALVAVIGAVDFRAFIGNEEYRIVNMKETLSLFDDISSDTIIISNFDQVQGLLSYYLNRDEEEFNVYLYGAEPEPLIYETVPGLKTIDDSIDIANYLENNKTVLFLGSFNAREVILDEWKADHGITSENEGSYLMERYWFDVFRLKR